MNFDNNILQAVEQLGYRVTVGDVASKSGLDINLAERGLLALASEAGGHLQVAETGDVVYQFPRNFRDILRNKYIQIQIKEIWEKIWRVLFYLVRLSFGIVLIASILVIFLAIFAIFVAGIFNSENGDGGDNDGNFSPNFSFFDGWLWFLYWDYDNRPYRPTEIEEKRELNFLESIFSFIFGDGNPNANLEEKRWQIIGGAVRKNQGAVVAEQIAPYLDEIGEGYAREYEEYMLPVLTKFNGKPEVSDKGQLIYHFPELQVSAYEGEEDLPLPVYLHEWRLRFSKATSGQIIWAIVLGLVNFGGAVFLGFLLLGTNVLASLGSAATLAVVIYGFLLAYGVGFLGIPLGRFFRVKWLNKKIEERNNLRESRAAILSSGDEELQEKLSFAQRFAGENMIKEENLIYTTETDLVEQEFKRLQAGDVDS